MAFVRRILPYLLLALTFLVLSVHFYKKTIALPPSHIHAWTQSDRYALALQFAENANLFKPRTFNLSTKDGVTAVDLPLPDYAAGLIMTATDSRAPVIFRVFTLLCCCTGYFFLFRLTWLLSGSYLKAWAAAVFFFTCPVITYYQAGFIPSSTSFAGILIAYFFFFKYLKNNNLRDFYFSIVFFATAALVRSPFNIFLFAVLLQRSLAWVQQKRIVRSEVYTFVAAYGVVFAYQFYKNYLTRTYGAMFLSRLTPADDWAGFKALLPSIFERWSLQVFSVFHSALLGLGVFFLISNLLKNKNLLPVSRSISKVSVEAEIVSPGLNLLGHVLLQSGITFAGACLYFALMAKQYVDHEYYFMDSFYGSAALLLVAGLCSVPTGTKMGKIAAAILLPALLAGGVYKSKQVQKEKYALTSWDRGEVTRKNFEGAAVLLDSLGIPATARVLVIDAYSTNAPLIALNRKGYTLMATNRWDLEKAMNLPFDYAVVQNLYFPSDAASNYPEVLDLLERVGGNDKISVLRRRSNASKGALAELLGLPVAVFQSILTFDDSPLPPFWNSAQQSAQRSVSPPNAGFLKPGIEFGPGFAAPLDHLPPAFSKLLFEGRFFDPAPVPASPLPDGSIPKSDVLYLVTSIERGDQKLFYEAYPLSVYLDGRWKVYQALFFLPTERPHDAVLKCYLWNPKGAELWFDDLGVRLF